MMDRKNVLLITVDQWAARNMGFAGNQEILTPTLDELARYGICYTNAVSNTPVCIPARRELMLGVGSEKHGDRCFDEELSMPRDIPSMASLFHNAGYQTLCVGKLHVFPQRDRIGFDDVILYEEGRHKKGLKMDDYERFLYNNGYAGKEYAHGMCNNNYFGSPFHLPDEYHPTAWTTRMMCEQILRRDITKPAFWYLSYAAPHPPLTPPAEYLHMYDNVEISQPRRGEWTNREDLPYGYMYYSNLYPNQSKPVTDIAKKAYYASCTYIDNQIRLVIGTLREQGLLDDTVILFTADHGDMLGNNRLFGKFLMYENSVNIPFILSPPADCGMVCNRTDDRIVELKDVVPTLLTLAGIDVPAHVGGESLTAESKRAYSYGELWEDDRATRMIRTKNYKLIYYPTGNCFQFFDIKHDPDELNDLIDNGQYSTVIDEMKDILQKHLYGGDETYVVNGEFVGLPHKKYDFAASIADKNKLFQGRDLLLQRGIR
jgi:arylsulfatase